MAKKITTEDFIARAKKVHGDKYDYGKAVYKNGYTKVIIFCKVCNEYFKQTPKNHYKYGCKKCGRKEQHNRQRLTTEEFITSAKEIHGEYYNYSSVDYKGSRIKVRIICPKHNVFLMEPRAHIQGQGCPKCGIIKYTKAQRMTIDEFIARAKKIHGDKYDYSKVDYINTDTKVIIFCKKCGEYFEQTPYSHYKNKAGCPTCAGNNKKTNIEFIKEASKIHNNKYDYSETEYVCAKDKIIVICTEHGPFTVTANNHISKGYGCPKCSHIVSKQEIEIQKFIQEFYNDEIILNSRRIIPPKELDIYIPGKRVAIEFDGIYWHSEAKGKHRNYHLDKTVACEEKDIQLFHIFSNEWEAKKEIWKSVIKNKLGFTERRIGARKCKVVEIDTLTSKQFCITNHLQGYAVASIRLALVFKDELVAVMTFGKSRFNKKYEYELIRFCNKLNTTVIGGASKLLSYFKKNYSTNIISFANKRWSDGGLYKSLGFKYLHTSLPNYFYFNNMYKLYSRNKFQKHKLKAQLETFDPNVTEVQNMLANGFNRIWDCGNLVYGYE